MSIGFVWLSYLLTYGLIVVYTAWLWSRLGDRERASDTPEG